MRKSRGMGKVTDRERKRERDVREAREGRERGKGGEREGQE